MSKALIFLGLPMAALLMLIFVVAPAVTEIVAEVESVQFALEYEAATESEAEALLQEDIIMLSDDHAVERHGEISLVIKSVCQSNPAVRMQRTADGRKALGCEYEPGKWGIAIWEDDGDFVTAFKNRARTLKELQQYLQGRGYQ